MKNNKHNHLQSNQEQQRNNRENQQRLAQRRSKEGFTGQSPTNQQYRSTAKTSQYSSAQRQYAKPEQQMNKNDDIMNQNLIEQRVDFPQYPHPHFRDPLQHNLDHLPPPYQYANDKASLRYKDFYMQQEGQLESQRHSYEFLTQQQEMEKHAEMPPHFQYMHPHQSGGQPPLPPHMGQHHYADPRHFPPSQSHQLTQHHLAQLKLQQNQKNYASEYQSDPDALLNLIDHQKEVLGAKKAQVEEEQYLSFSEASEDYEYYFYRVKKNRQGGGGQGQQNQETGQINNELLKTGIKGSSQQTDMMKFRSVANSNKHQYEGQLNMINESSQENISVEVSGRFQDKKDMIRKSKQGIHEKQSIDLSTNKNNQSGQNVQEQHIDQTISSIRDIGQKSNSLLISKFDSQNEQSLLTPHGHGRKVDRGQSPPHILRDNSDQIQVYNGKPLPTQCVEIMLHQDSSKVRNEKRNIAVKQITIDKKQLISTPKGGSEARSKRDESPLRKKLENDQRENSANNRNKTFRQNKQVPPANTKVIKKPKEKMGAAPKNLRDLNEARTQVHQINLKSKPINLMNSQDSTQSAINHQIQNSTQPATGNESSFKNQVLDSKQKIKAKFDSSGTGNNELEVKREGNHQKISHQKIEGQKTSHKRQKSSQHERAPKPLNDLQESQMPELCLSGDNPFQPALDVNELEVCTPQQTKSKYTEEFPSALAYPKNNFQTPFGAQTVSDISALTQQKHSNISKNKSSNNAAVAVYGETGSIRNRYKNNSCLTSQKQPRNQYLNTVGQSDKKSFKSYHTNTTAMIDDMSFPDERSIDFKANEFGAKNLRQIVKEEEQVLLTKIKKVNPVNKQIITNANKKSQVKYEPLSKTKIAQKPDNKNNNGLMDINPSNTFSPQMYHEPKPPIPKTQRPRIKHTFRGGNAYEHVSISPVRNHNPLKSPKEVELKQSNRGHFKTLRSDSPVHKPNLKNRKVSQKPVQVQAPDPSMSGVSKGMSVSSPTANDRRSANKKKFGNSIQTKEEIIEYKQVETLEFDHVYQDNIYHGNYNNYFNSDDRQFEMDGPHDPHYFGAMHMQPPMHPQQQYFFATNGRTQSNGRISSDPDNMEFYGIGPRIDSDPNVNSANPRTQSKQSNVNYIPQDSEETSVVIEQPPKKQTMKSTRKRSPNNSRHSGNADASLSKSNSPNQSMRNSRNQIGHSQLSSKARNRVNNNNDKDSILQSSSSKKINKKGTSPDIIVPHSGFQSRQKHLDQQKQNSLKEQAKNQNFSPQVFDGSSFGGSQVSQHQMLLSVHQSSQKDHTFQQNQQIAPGGVTKFPNTFGMDNRPYVPKATVILNQDTDYEQLDINVMDQRPFSQTVVEVPTVITQPSKSSLNYSKKSNDRTSRAGSQCSDQAPKSSRDKSRQLPHNLNSIYSKTEPVSKRTFLRKGEGSNKRWSSNQKTTSQQQNENSESQRCDSQKASNLYFKALKDIGPSTNQKSNRDRQSSHGSGSSQGDYRKNNQLIRVPQSIKGNDPSVYYSTLQPKTTSYKQKQINSIEKLKKELARSQGSRSNQSSQKSSKHHSKELLQQVGLLHKGSYSSQNSGQSRGSSKGMQNNLPSGQYNLKQNFKF